MLAAGAVDRLDERWFRVRHRAGAAARQDGSSSRKTIAESLDGGLAFLKRTQRSNGFWRGFMMAPGASTEWISAHVALLLEDVAHTQAMRELVAQGLLASTRRRAGWGYNRRVRVDGDSTAQAIIAIRRVGGEVAPASVQALLATRREDGFATYASTRPDGQPSTWWEMPHADVTLIVIEALRRLEDFGEQRQAAIDWLSDSVVDGVLPAYWWTSPAYTLWAQARAGFELSQTARVASEMLVAEERPVYLAMLIAAALGDGGWSPTLATAVERLVCARRADGSWLCAPCLRPTPSHHEGGFDAPGPVYGDPYRVFSTAHAVAALSLALRASASAERT
jgi:hypothetical protein